MQSTVERLDDSRVRVTLEFTEDETRAAFRRAVGDVGRQVTVPGFRHGKAPRGLLERVVGPEVIQQHVVADLVPHALARVMEQDSLRAVAEPELDFEPPADAKPFRVVATLPVLSKVSLDSLPSVSVIRPTLRATDDDVEAALGKRREAAASSVAVTDRPIQVGDFVYLRYQITTDEGTSVYNADELPTMHLQVGAHWYSPPLDDHLTGLSVGETKQIEVVYPPDHEDDSLAGKQVTYTVTVDEIKERHVPPLDDSFAQSLGCSTLAELREQTCKQLDDILEEQFGDGIEARVLDAVAQACNIRVPDVLVNAQAEELARQLEAENARKGRSIEAQVESTGMTREQLDEVTRSRAAGLVARHLLIDAVADEERIEVTDESLEEQVWVLARAAKTTFSEMWAMLQKSGQLEEMRDRERTRRAVECIMGRINLVPREMSLEEYATLHDSLLIRLDEGQPPAAPEGSDTVSADDLAPAADQGCTVELGATPSADADAQSADHQTEEQSE